MCSNIYKVGGRDNKNLWKGQFLTIKFTKTTNVNAQSFIQGIIEGEAA